MKNAARTNRLFALLTLIVATASTAVGSEMPQQVTVQLQSGRSFHAAVDARTDDTTLWLRFDSTTTALYRPVAWNRVVEVSVNGNNASGEVFQASVAQHVSHRDQFLSAAADEEATTTNNVDADDARSHAEIASEAITTDRVSSVEVRAYVADWDADVEVDGLIVHVLPLNAAGEVIAVRGVVQAELVGSTLRDKTLRSERLRSLAGLAPPPQLQAPTQSLAHWTRNLQSDRVSASGAVFQLPFAADHPEFDTELDHLALLHVKLTVPGSGVFETTATDVNIRPVSELRDRLQGREGHRRFLDQENTAE